MSFCDLEGLKLFTMIYRCKFEENPSTGSKIFYFQDYDLENGVKITKILSAFKLVTVIYFVTSLKKIHQLVQKIFY